jgi:hypothetical protein
MAGSPRSISCTANGRLSALEATIPKVTGEMSNGIDLLLTPNPTSGKAEANFILNDQQEVALALRNILGQVVWKKVMMGVVGINKVIIDLSPYLDGVYLVQLQVENNTTSKRVVLIK